MVFLAALLAVIAGSFTSASAATTGGSTATTTPNASNDPGVTNDSVTLGIVTSISGPESSSFGEPVVAGAQAAANVANKDGGIDGRKIKIISADYASSSSEDLTAVQNLVSRGAFAILSGTPNFFGAYRYTTQLGIPVTGVALDGPEWGDPQHYNLFDAFGSPATNFPANTMTGAYFKHYGVTKLATVSIGASPSSTGNAKAIAESAEKAGIKVPIQDSIAATDSDFTSLALEMKSQGVNGIATEITTNENVAIMGDVKTQGIDLKGTWFQGLYYRLFWTTLQARRPWKEPTQ